VTEKRYDLDPGATDSWSEKLAWKRVGFKNFDDIKQQVRDMSIEEKIELLTELYIDDMARNHFTKKTEFLRKLGKKTWVEREEIINYAKETFISSNIDEYRFHDNKWINPFTGQFQSVQKMRIEKLLKEDKK